MNQNFSPQDQWQVVLQRITLQPGSHSVLFNVAPCFPTAGTPDGLRLNQHTRQLTIGEERETKGGIALPDQAEIPTITGRIVTISAQVEHDEDVPLRQYDKILFHPKNAIPVDLEPDNQLFVVPIEDVVAVFRRDESEE